MARLQRDRHAADSVEDMFAVKIVSSGGRSESFSVLMSVVSCGSELPVWSSCLRWLSGLPLTERESSHHAMVEEGTCHWENRRKKRNDDASRAVGFVNLCRGLEVFEG